MPQPLRWTVQRTIFQLLDEPVPALADPFPRDDPLPGAYELHLPADDVTIWYTVTEHEGHERDFAVSLVHTPVRHAPPLLVSDRLRAALPRDQAPARLDSYALLASPQPCLRFVSQDRSPLAVRAG